MTEESKKITLNLLLAFVLWGTFKNAETVLRPVSSSREIFSAYSIEWVYFLITAFAVIGGLALAYAIFKKKEWGYPLGFAWLGLDLATTVFSGLVSLLDKPLTVEVLKKMAMSRGRDENYISSIGDFATSSAFDLTVILTAGLFALIAVFFLWQLYKKKEYFKQSPQG